MLSRIFITATVLLIATPVQQRLNSPPMSAASEQGAAIAQARDGTVRWKNRWTMEKTSVEGQPVIRFSEHGEGIRSRFPQPVSWTILSTWSTDRPPRPLRAESTYVDAGGRMLLQENRSFDWTRGQMRFEQTAADGGRREEVLRVQTDALMADGIAGILRGLDFTTRKPVVAHVIGNDLKIYEVSFEVRGKEQIQTASGSVEAFKVELVPHLGVLDLFRFLYPKTYFWLRVEAPHTWLRYEGLEDGPGSPEIVLTAE
jgi:hypothetical protein